ncbi:baseplate J/gp47 family protein [uncultured Oscillibacter sp.]|uniref:baseplate J/gp47 family protein n=1 Tax=uncultured Oscillibacter sp. TaxID=876091 RepID=UPI0025E1CCA9|nr:baseplate J/gp47 family protein [uncultured Oscillibacter sp.]
MYETLTVEEVKQRILGRIQTELDTREGSQLNDEVSAIAAELCEAYHSLDALEPMFYLEEASGPYIDKQAAVVGIVRKAGAFSSCAVTFTGADGATVPAGMPFYTADGLEFLLDGAVTLAGGTGSGTLTAARVGEAYNIGAGEITQTLQNVTGISGYTNGRAAGGADPESDGALLERYLERMRRSPTSGNPYHYQQWAAAVDGVGAARVVSKWDGPGTVKVLLAGPGMEPVDGGVESACAAYIESRRPVGAAVTVAAAGTREMAVHAAVTIDGTTTKAAVQTALEAAVGDYLRQLAREAFADNIDLQLETLAEKTYTVLYNRIAYLLLSIPGVVDYTALTLGGGTANIPVPADAVPVLTGVSVS